MPENDLVFVDFVDNEYRLCGFLVGTSPEKEHELRQKYKVWTYGHFVRHWRDKAC